MEKYGRATVDHEALLALGFREGALVLEFIELAELGETRDRLAAVLELAS